MRQSWHDAQYLVSCANRCVMSFNFICSSEYTSFPSAIPFLWSVQSVSHYYRFINARNLICVCRKFARLQNVQNVLHRQAARSPSHARFNVYTVSSMIASQLNLQLTSSRSSCCENSYNFMIDQSLEEWARRKDFGPTDRLRQQQRCCFRTSGRGQKRTGSAQNSFCSFPTPP